MKTVRPHQIKPSHIQRVAVIYQRVGVAQVANHVGSFMFQNRLLDPPQAWGWPEERIVLIADEACSGASGALRPGFTRLLKMLDEEQVGIICVSDLSRLSRSPQELFAIRQVCHRHATLVAVEEVIWDDNTWSMEGIKRIFTGFESKQRSEATRRGIRARKARLAQVPRSVR